MAAERSPLRLATVTNFFPTHGGGLEVVAEKLVEEFTARGVCVEWVSTAIYPPPAVSSDHLAYSPVRATNLIERLTQLPYPLWSPVAFPTLWRAVGGADVVHVHEHLYFGSLLAIVMARLRRRPVVITQHMGALGLGGRTLTVLYETAARVLGYVTFTATARTVFISANVRRFFRRETSPNARLIFNGIDTARFTGLPPAQRNALRERLGFPADRPVVLFVGRFVRKKGFVVIESLVRRFPQLLWVFAGWGPEDPSSWEHPNVRVVGRVGHDALPGYYQAADLLLLPSSGEGFPLVVQEALACGLGVLSTEEVGTACPPAGDMIRTCPTPRDANNIIGWERALQATLADEAYLSSRDARARKARELWSWDRCASEYMCLFEEIALARPRPELLKRSFLGLLLRSSK